MSLFIHLRILLTWSGIFSRTAKEILSIVQAAIVKYGATEVTTVGHSLGAFILELFILLKIFLTCWAYRSCDRSSRCYVSSSTYQWCIIQNDRLWNASSLCYVSSIPLNLDLYFILVQVGNRAFADYIDAHLDVTHINNKSVTTLFFLFFLYKYLDLNKSNLIIRRFFL